MLRNTIKVMARLCKKWKNQRVCLLCKRQKMIRCTRNQNSGEGSLMWWVVGVAGLGVYMTAMARLDICQATHHSDIPPACQKHPTLLSLWCSDPEIFAYPFWVEGVAGLLYLVHCKGIAKKLVWHYNLQFMSPPSNLYNIVIQRYNLTISSPMLNLWLFFSLILYHTPDCLKML